MMRALSAVQPLRDYASTLRLPLLLLMRRSLQTDISPSNSLTRLIVLLNDTFWEQPASSVLLLTLILSGTHCSVNERMPHGTHA